MQITRTGNVSPAALPIALAVALAAFAVGASAVPQQAEAASAPRAPCSAP